MGCSWAAASGVQQAGAYRVATRTAYYLKSPWLHGGAVDFKVGCKTGFASGASEKNMYPTFPNVGLRASKYQSGELKFSHLYSTE